MKHLKSMVLLWNKASNILFKKVKLISICIIFSSMSAYAQGVEPIIKKMMDNLRRDGSEAVNVDPLFTPANAALAIQALERYSSDSLFTIRSRAFNLIGAVGKKSANPLLRKQAVNHLLKGCRDRESSIVGMCSKALHSYNPEDFDASARKQILTLLINPVTYLNHIAQLAGYIGDKEYAPLLLDRYNNPKTSRRDKFALQLALARMGNTEMQDQILSRIKNLSVNDDLIYEAGPALAYIRQKPGVDYLFAIILSEEKNCESANPDSNTKILCAYRVLEFVAPVVKNFPLKIDESGDLDADNYEDALKTARAWIIANKDNYEILRNRF